MEPGDPDVVESFGVTTVRGEGDGRLVGHGGVRGAGSDDQHPDVDPGFGSPPEEAASQLFGGAVLGEHRLGLIGGRARQQHRSGAVVEQFTDDPNALLGALARAVDGFGHTLAKRPVMIDEGLADVGERETAQLGHGVIGGRRPGPDRLDQRS